MSLTASGAAPMKPRAASGPESNPERQKHARVQSRKRMLNSFDAREINGQAASGYALRSLSIDDEFTPTANSKGVNDTSKEL